MTKILIVDDSAFDRRLVGGLLEKISGVRTSYAVNGRDALKAIDSDAPDLVLTDLEMPEMNGLELTGRLRNFYPSLPVILMTAAGSEQIAVKALQAGAASYVSKTNLPDELWPIISNVLRVSAERRTNARILNRIHRWEADFVLENDLDLVNGLSSYLMQSFGGLRICTSAEQLRVGVALEEALLNAYYHGNLEVSSKLRESSYHEFSELARIRSTQSPYQERKIRVSVRFSTREAVFHVRDDGPGFDISSLPDPTDPLYLERPHGRGLLLMRTFLDEVRHNSRGNEVTLVKKASRIPGSDGSQIVEQS